MELEQAHSLSSSCFVRWPHFDVVIDVLRAFLSQVGTL